MIVVGPGSYTSSLLPHFMVQELAQEIENARARGVKVIFFNNACADNETINLPFIKLIESFDIVSKRSFENLFTHMIVSRFDVLDLMPNLIKRLDKIEQDMGTQVDTLEASRVVAKEVVEKIAENTAEFYGRFRILRKYAQEVVKHGETPGMINEIIADEDKKAAFVEKIAILINTVYGKRPMEIRTDPAAASKAAKKSIGPMVLTPQDKDHLRGVRIMEDSLITYVRVQEREASKFTDRVLYDVDGVAELFRRIASSPIGGKEIPYLERPISDDEQAQAVVAYGEGSIVKAKAVMTEGGFSIEVLAGAFAQGQEEVLRTQLEGLSRLIRGPPVEVMINVTTHRTDLAIGTEPTLYIATSDIHQRTVYIHPQYFKESPVLQFKILYHEIISHIKNIVNLISRRLIEANEDPKVLIDQWDKAFVVEGTAADKYLTKVKIAFDRGAEGSTQISFVIPPERYLDEKLIGILAKYLAVNINNGAHSVGAFRVHVEGLSDKFFDRVKRTFEDMFDKHNRNGNADSASFYLSEYFGERFEITNAAAQQLPRPVCESLDASHVSRGVYVGLTSEGPRSR